MNEELFIVGSEPTFGTWNMANYIYIKVFPPFPQPLVFFKIEDKKGYMITTLLNFR